MKRIADGRRYPAVLCGETVKGCDGFGVTQDYGNLATLGAQGGLPLRSGFGLGHWSACHFPHVLDALAIRLHRGQLDGGGLAPNRNRFGDGELALFNGDPDQRPALGTKGVSESLRLGELGSESRIGLAQAGIDSGAGGGDGFGLGHFVLRVGPIPTVETSYPVTSDKSTPNATVRREVA